MNSRILAFWLSGTVLLGGCGNDTSPASDVQATSQLQPIQIERNDVGSAAKPSIKSAQPENVERAVSALKAEEWVRVVHYEAGKFPNWILEVKGKGQPEYGYGDIACMIIREQGAEVDRTAVRLVDQASFQDSRNSRDSSLGMVDCSSGAYLS